MPGWILVKTDPTQGRTFRRPLDEIEAGFFWDGRFSGTADNLYHVEIRLLNPSHDVQLFSEANIVKAWLSTKMRYPLSGAIVQILSGETSSNCIPVLTSGPHFIVQERDFAVLRPHEITFDNVACAEEVQGRIAAIFNGPRPLSDELLAQLYVFHETDPQRMNTLHLITVIAHCVTDGMANRSFMRCLLDTLSRGGDPDSEPAQIPLEDRLAMVISSADLVPAHFPSPSLARLRWRMGIGAVIFQSRMANIRGGHTLPCRLTHATPHTPSRSEFISTFLSQEQTASVIANCRLHGLTFGNAYLALAQVAMTRVLYRQYLHGEISDEEWTYRKRQPYRGLAPFNLRRYLDKPWFERGGGGEFMVAINIFIYSLPFMTLGGTGQRTYSERDLSDGAPPFSALLTFDRFLYRAGLIKKQAQMFFNHPLFFEILHATNLFFVHRSRLFALEWMSRQSGTTNSTTTHGTTDEDDAALSVMDMPMVLATGGSSLGNVHLLSPTEYPLPPSHLLSPYSTTPHPAKAGYTSSLPFVEENPTPTIVVDNSATRVHARPGELYLGALTSRGQMSMYASYDGNVYKEEVVREWLNEVKGAVLWYLNQPHRSHCDLDPNALQT